MASFCHPHKLAFHHSGVVNY